MNGNISTDPLFANSSAGDYHLRPASPSIDTGDISAPNLPATDFDGNPRIQDGNLDGIAVIDMGAYEALPPTTPFNICIQDGEIPSRFFIACSEYIQSRMPQLDVSLGTEATIGLFS